MCSWEVGHEAGRSMSKKGLAETLSCCGVGDLPEYNQDIGSWNRIKTTLAFLSFMVKGWRWPAIGVAKSDEKLRICEGILVYSAPIQSQSLGEPFWQIAINTQVRCNTILPDCEQLPEARLIWNFSFHWLSAASQHRGLVRTQDRKHANYEGFVVIYSNRSG